MKKKLLPKKDPLGVAPSQDSSHKWRFSSELPTKNGIYNPCDNYCSCVGATPKGS